MSLPKEILEQLLSGYLDDALSADERARVERLIETDADAASQLEQLRDLRQALKEVSRADAGFKLPAGFADRVLDASVAAAASEGLSEDHPLVRLAEQPTSGRSAICGEDVLENPIAAKRHMGYLPEGAPSYGEMTVNEFLEFIARAREIPGPDVGRMAGAAKTSVRKSA